MSLALPSGHLRQEVLLVAPDPSTRGRTAPSSPAAPSSPEPNELVVRIAGPIDPAAVPDLCDRARAVLLERGAGRVVCDVRELDPADIGSVDALARVVLTARRVGGEIELWYAPPGLRELLAFLGLSGVVRCRDLGEAVGKAEQGEEAGRVEEERDPPDPAP
jgi:ABC-type transporter Mla MlaB component